MSDAMITVKFHPIVQKLLIDDHCHICMIIIVSFTAALLSSVTGSGLATVLSSVTGSGLATVIAKECEVADHKHHVYRKENIFIQLSSLVLSMSSFVVFAPAYLKPRSL